MKPSRVRIVDVAKAAGVSAATVSMVLNNKGSISASTRQHVLAVADELGYIHEGSNKDTAAQMLALVVEELPVPLFADPFCSEIMAGVEEEARRLGFGMLLVVLPTIKGETVIPNNLRGRNLAGIIGLGGGDLADSTVQEIVALGHPVVLVDNHLPEPSAFGTVSSIVADNFRAGYLATQHLLRLGKRRLAIIQGSRKYKPLNERFYGFLAAMMDYGVKPEEQYICQKISRGATKGQAEAEYLLSLSNPPEGIICISDKVALNVLGPVMRLGLQVPQNIGIVGIDDIYGASQTDPPLTTVRIPKREMGRVAVRQLLRCIDTGQEYYTKTCLPVELVIRGSCGART
ncbi:MAG: LacI family DNA-binding transcriptional regulator [Limnochordia bacterium]|nr:LacI family transcriptional regulator [Limnochordia bacterium]MDD2628546.1 LacI family DNA-binding transcriptional regulator [Limnochordia bacterium]